MYLIREAEIADIYRLARNLRDGDRLEVTSLGTTPAEALRKSFKHAIFRRTALIEGQIAAVWGLGGSMLGDTGYPWLLTAPIIETLPLSFVREARGQVWDMMSRKRRLEGLVAADYRCACRFLQVLGFTLDEPQPMPPHKVKFRKFWMAI